MASVRENEVHSQVFLSLAQSFNMSRNSNAEILECHHLQFYMNRYILSFLYRWRNGICFCLTGSAAQLAFIRLLEGWWFPAHKQVCSPNILISKKIVNEQSRVISPRLLIGTGKFCRWNCSSSGMVFILTEMVVFLHLFEDFLFSNSFCQASL